MMEETERLAYLHGGRMGGEYLESIKKYNLAELSPDEWLTLLECTCKAYHIEFIRLESLFQSQLLD
jgi:hypothetical protein